MKTFRIVPQIYEFSTFQEFAQAFSLGEKDLIVTQRFTYDPFIRHLHLPCPVIFQEDYGKEEPTDLMVNRIVQALRDVDYRRVVAVGGGTVIDICKLLAQQRFDDVEEIFAAPEKSRRDKPLLAVPTTCGTGSEVTNLSILALISLNTKKGLGAPCMFGDKAVLVPELLKTLPLSVFATSSIDALIHSIESSLSPKANPITELFGYKAIEIILKGYMEIRDKGAEARIPLLKDFLLASTYGGIAFGNAGCAAVHALSYPLGAAYHVPHGESNYAMFTGVMKKYMSIRTDGAIAKLNAYMAGILGCDVDKVYEALEDLLNTLLPKKALHEYGMKESELEEFTDSVIANQQRLLNNNFVPLSRQDILDIYTSLY